QTLSSLLSFLCLSVSAHTCVSPAIDRIAHPPSLRLSLHCSMLKVPEHQVAGHQARDGKLGPLVDDSGRFYKPLQDDDRGSNEVALYSSFSSNTRIPDHIRRFFPNFYGTQLLEASNGSGLRPHLILQDLLSDRVNPSIMDVKIGSRTWYPQASEDYIQKCLKKDRETTSLSLGFRISGLQIYGSKESRVWKPEKKLVHKFTVDDVRVILRKFVSSNISTNSNVNMDCSFAQTVYGGSAGILAQLMELKAWFEDQTMYHFNSCSVIMVYEKESVLKGGNAGPQVQLVDFAHAMEGKGVIDHNFLGGLCSLIKFVSEILIDPDEYPSKGCSEG
ncbi:IPK domain-containing protein, partial [Cephalotus follicularis]